MEEPGEGWRRPRAKRGEGERLRTEILEAASELLIKTGDEASVSVRAVAQAVGVTAPSIYLHFQDRAQLLIAVCQRQYEQLDEFIQARVNAVGDPLEQLKARARAYIEFGVEHPEHYRVLFMNKTARVVDLAGGGRQASETGFHRLVDNVQRAIAAGAIRHRDTLFVSTAMWSLVHGVVALAVTLPHYPQGTTLDELVDYVLGVWVDGVATVA
jgi:AcrR family transcriptional regulator